MNDLSTLSHLFESYLTIINSTDKSLLNDITNTNNITIELGNDIYDSINNNITNSIYTLLRSSNSTKTVLFYSLIRRIGNLINHNMTDQQTLPMQLLKVYNHYTDYKTNETYKNDIMKCIELYAADNNIGHLDILFNIAIKYKQLGTIDKLKNHITIDDFIDKSSHNQNILQMKGRKLFDLLIFKNV